MTNIKKPSYISCDKNTLIKDVPNIINKNNEENSRLFKELFEFGATNDKIQTQQYIKVPVITKGLVKAGSGQFFNLYANRISFSKESNEYDFLNIITNHQNNTNRFKIDNYSSEIKNNYAHDAEFILYNGTTSLKGELDALINKVDKLQLDNDYDEEISEINNRLKALEDAISRIVSNLNINNQNQYSINEANDNMELIDAINNPTSSYTYSSNYYPKNN